MREILNGNVHRFVIKSENVALANTDENQTAWVIATCNSSYGDLSFHLCGLFIIYADLFKSVM